MLRLLVAWALLAAVPLAALGQSTALSNAAKLKDIVVATDPAFSGGAKCNDSADDYAALQAAITYAYNSGIGNVILPTGTCRISKPLYLWGATHYWFTTAKAVCLIGQGQNSTVIKKTTNNGTGDGSAYTALDAVILPAPFDKIPLDGTWNVCLKELQLTSTGTSTYGITGLGPLARFEIDGVTIQGVGTALRAQSYMYLTNIRRLTVNATTYGIRMDTTGTSVHLDDVFVTGTNTVAYLLRGGYSTGNALAADNNTGVIYQFGFGDWVINGLGSESTGATKIIELLGSSNNRVIVNNPYIQPPNGAGSVVFTVNAGSRLIVNGGSVGTDASPQVKLGKLAAVTDGVSVTPNEGLFLNNVAILDTYTVASTGASLRQSGGSTKFGKKSVATATATALYTVQNEEVGIFIAYGTGNATGNANIYSMAYVGVAGGNPGFAVISTNALVLTNVAGVITVQHALGVTYDVGWKFLTFGDAYPVAW